MRKTLSLTAISLLFIFYQDQSKWNEFILDPLNGVSLKETTTAKRGLSNQ